MTRHLVAPRDVITKSQADRKSRIYISALVQSVFGDFLESHAAGQSALQRFADSQWEEFSGTWNDVALQQMQKSQRACAQALAKAGGIPASPPLLSVLTGLCLQHTRVRELLWNPQYKDKVHVSSDGTLRSVFHNPKIARYRVASGRWHDWVTRHLEDLQAHRHRAIALAKTNADHADAIVDLQNVLCSAALAEMSMADRSVDVYTAFLAAHEEAGAVLTDLTKQTRGKVIDGAKWTLPRATSVQYSSLPTWLTWTDHQNDPVIRRAIHYRGLGHWHSGVADNTYLAMGLLNAKSGPSPK